MNTYRFSKKTTVAYVGAVTALLGAIVPFTGPTVLIAVTFAILAFSLRNYPRAAAAFWLGATFVTPIWIGPTFFVFFPPSTIYTLAVVPAIFKAIRPKLSWTDMWLSALTACALVAVTLASSPRSAFAELVVNWLPAYFVARMLTTSAGLSWLLRCFSTVAAFVAGWAIAEYLFDLHLLTNFLTQTSQGFWAEIQYRNGVARSEASLGHAIALGGSLVLAIPIALTSYKSPLTRTLVATLLCAGVLTTQSRGPIIGALIAIVISISLFRTLKTSTRLLYGLLISIFFVFVAPSVWKLFTSGEDEITDSTAYREALLSSFSRDLHLLGPASGVTKDAAGTIYYRSYQSIDSTHVLFGIEYGWIFLTLLAIGAVALLIRTLQGRSIAAICLLPQLAILYTVAPITQYAILISFMIGCYANTTMASADQKLLVASADQELLDTRLLETAAR